MRNVAKVQSEISSLISKGINLTTSEPQYKFTRLNDIKPELLKEATQNARIAASEFAQTAGAKVGNSQRRSRKL